MPSKNFRYQDSALLSNKISAPHKLQPNLKHTSHKKDSAHTFLPDLKKDLPKKPLANILSFDKLKNLSTDDYILLFLIFMLIKDNDNPDWPLIGSLGYILFGFDE